MHPPVFKLETNSSKHRNWNLLLGRKSMANLDSILKSRDITLPTKVCIVKVMVFPVVTYRCESWTIKKAECRRIYAFKLWRYTLESPLDCKEIQPVHPKGNQPWIFIERTDAEAETPILWPPDVKNWFIGKDSDAVKDWGQEKKEVTEDEMVAWHHQLNGHEFEQMLGDREAWCAAVHGVPKRQTQLGDWTTATTETVLGLRSCLREMSTTPRLLVYFILRKPCQSSL